MLEFLALAEQCAPTVDSRTMAAIVRTESSFNPFAIGVVGGSLRHQPRSLDEAVKTAAALEAGGWNFSVGLTQVNRYNLAKYGLSYAQAFDPCRNLQAGSKILQECYVRAARRMPDKGQQGALQAAFSCYYSGNFTRGFKPDKRGEPSYVQKVLAVAGAEPKAIPVVPAIAGAKRPPRYDRAAEDAALPAPAAAAQQASPPPSAPAAPLPPPDHTSVLIDLHDRSPTTAGAATGDAVEASPASDASAMKPFKVKSVPTATPAATDVIVF